MLWTQFVYSVSRLYSRVTTPKKLLFSKTIIYRILNRIVGKFNTLFGWKCLLLFCLRVVFSFDFCIQTFNIDKVFGICVRSLSLSLFISCLKFCFLVLHRFSNKQLKMNWTPNVWIMVFNSTSSAHRAHKQLYVCSLCDIDCQSQNTLRLCVADSFWILHVLRCLWSRD